MQASVRQSEHCRRPGKDMGAQNKRAFRESRRKGWKSEDITASTCFPSVAWTGPGSLFSGQSVAGLNILGSMAFVLFDYSPPVFT